MLFGMFNKKLVDVLFVWISIPICSAQEYTARNIDCNSTFKALSYNVTSRQQCILKCLQENCFHAKYENQSCLRYGRNPQVASNGHIMTDTYQILAKKNVARPGLNTSLSSQYGGGASSSVIDGNEATIAATNWDPKAWWWVDLGKSYYIVQIGFLIHSSHLYYFKSMQIYLSDSPATPAQFPLQPVFASYPGPPTVNRFNISGSPGLCGRFLVVQCQVGYPIEMLEVVIYSLDGVVIV